MRFTSSNAPTTLQKGDRFLIDLSERYLSFHCNGEHLLIDGHTRFPLAPDLPWKMSSCQFIVSLIGLLAQLTPKCLDRGHDRELYELVET